MIRCIARSFSTNIAALEQWYGIDKMIWKKEISATFAMESYEKLATSHPKDLPLMANYAWYSAKQKKYPVYEALSVAISEIDSSSLLPDIFNYLLSSKKESTDKDWAVLFKKSIARNLSPTEQKFLSMCFKKRESLHSALSELKKYFKADSAKNDILAMQCKLDLEIKCERYDDAIVTADKMLNLNPESLEIPLLRIKALQGIGKSNAAFFDITRIINERDVTNKQKGFMLKERAACRPSNDIEGKLDDLLIANTLNPESGAWENIIILMYKENRLKDLSKIIDENADSQANFATAIARGDIARIINKNYEKAKEEYKKAYDLISNVLHKAEIKKRIKEMESVISKGNKHN